MNATVIVDSNRIRLDISEGEKIGFVNTSNCSRLDPIVYTAKEMANNMPVFDLNFKAGKNDITAHVMPDLNGGGLTALVGDIGLYAYDKLYISNKLGTYSMEFETVKSIASQFGLDIGDDGLNIGDIINKLSDNMNYSVFDEDNMLIALIRYNDMDINLYFDYATSFFDHATIDNGNFTVDLTISSLDSLYKPEQFTASPIDSISGIINPVKNLISGNTITVNLKNLIAKTSGLNIDGFVSFTNKKVSETETKLDLALEINLKKTETHTIKARLENGNNIRAYYIYGGKTMQLGLTKDNLLSMAFKVTDILGIKLDMLEKYRPTISDPVSSPIIYNALPADFRDSLIKIVDLLEKGLSLQNISLSDLIEYAELLSINAQTGKLSLSVQNDSPIEIEVGYSNLRIKSVKLDSASISGNIELDRTFTDIGGDTVGSININGLNEMLTHVLNTVNLGEYNVKGKIDLKLDILNISIPAMVINFDLTAKIVDNKTPYVYLHLSVPKVNVLKTLLHQAESFLFFYDGMMYLKSERYDDSLFGGNNYKETLFKKCNPKEFANNLVDYLFFLVPLDESIQTPIKEQIAAGTSENASYAEALSSFNASVDKYEIAIDLNKLTGKSSLDILNLTFLVTENEQKHHREISSFDINTKMLKVLNNYLINLSIAAKLHAYDGIIEYGVNRDTTSGNILNMPNEIKEMKKTVPEWN